MGFDLVESFGGNLTAEQALVVYDKCAHGVFGIVIEHRHGGERGNGKTRVVGAAAVV